MTDEVVKLILDLAGSSKDVAELIGRLGELKGKTLEVGDTYEVLSGEMGTFAVAERKATDATQQYTPALDAAVQKAVEATQAQKLLRQSLETTAVAQEKAAGLSKANAQRILEWGRATQDFAQGGFAGIINNIERMVGGAGPAAGILTAIGTAAFIAKPFIEEWAKSLQGAGEKVPPAAKEMDRFTEALAKNKKELQDLKEKQELTYFELLKYKDLVAKTTELEEDQARKREAYLVQAGSDKKSRDRAAAVRETVAERFESSELLIEHLMGTEQGQQLGRKRIEEMVAGAQKGSGLDITGLGHVSSKFKYAYEQFSPERKAADEQSKERAQGREGVYGPPDEETGRG